MPARLVPAAAVLAAAALSLGGAAPPGPGAWSVVALDAATGRPVAARPLPASGAFALAYVHSAYRAPTAELFAAAGRRFTMYAVASPNEAVLDYYAVPGARARRMGWWVLRLDRPVLLDELSLIGTPVGRRTLVTAAGCVPLYPRFGAYDLRIRVMAGHRAGAPVPCPPGPRRVIAAPWPAGGGGGAVIREGRSVGPSDPSDPSVLSESRGTA
ncbi:MAG TPA: hypothetical protein VFU43_07105 [Streptosporangiaceae bacterium]|nr:hypothetical protein [Streptosporangiaceae bacterium]